MSFTSAMSAVTATPINLTSGKLDIKTEEGEESLAGHTAIKADWIQVQHTIIRYYAA